MDGHNGTRNSGMRRVNNMYHTVWLWHNTLDQSEKPTCLLTTTILQCWRHAQARHMHLLQHTGSATLSMYDTPHAPAAQHPLLQQLQKQCTGQCTARYIHCCAACDVLQMKAPRSSQHKVLGAQAAG
jgi:hypothetical protein